MTGTRRAMFALFLLAMSVLVLEVSLTRVFSVMSWHHFAYLIISLALLGFGAASSFMTVSKRFSGDSFEPARLARYALGFSLAIIFSFATATKVRFFPLDAYTYGDYSNVYSLSLLYVIVGAPFFFAGVCIAYLISRAREAINRLYFADLLGAGVGALLAILGINQLGVEATIYAAATASALVAAVYAFEANSSRRLRVATLVVCGVALLMTGVASKREIFPVYFPPDKIFRLAMEPHDYSWHVVARVDILAPQPGIWSFGGVLSKSYRQENSDVPEPEVRGVYQDGGAATGIIGVTEGGIEAIPALGYYLQGAPFVLQENPERTLVIGVGGGSDVMIALYNGAQHVDGVEVNPVVVDALQNRYDDFAGGVFNSDRVSMIEAEGRSYLTGTQQKYDVIQLSGVDTYSALSSGAYALAENYLYTVEAMHDYWDHLQPDGILSFSRWLFEPPRETLRLVATQATALAQMEVDHPERHFMVIRGIDISGNIWAETLMKRSPFTRENVDAYAEWAQHMGFEILWDPLTPRDNEFNRILTASPKERQTLISNYLYNIKPVTDNGPFFFDFYRWRSLWDPQASKGTGGYYITKFPMALVVLLASLVQILILASIFVVGPLLQRGNELRAIAHKRGVLVYFGALGLGFISVEIVMLQKYQVFVGGPVYAMAITLFAILVFSGLGSLLAQRWTSNGSAALTKIFVGLVLLIVAEAIFVDHAVPRLLFLSHAMRCVVAIVALAPLALLMGMPFPTGLRVAQKLGPSIVPWVWGVNAVTTTLGSMLCVLASMQWGFDASLMAAAVIYLVGFAALRPVMKHVLRSAS